MNSFTILSLFICVATATSLVLPELHVIKRVSFKYPYGCQPGPSSYENCALFISPEAAARNSPDLLYNGACGSDNYFDVMLAGNDFGMLSDLGDVPLENLTASRAFNYENRVGQDNMFTNTIEVVKEHTYAALLARQGLRALFVFRVENYERGGPVTLAYAVKQYGVIQSVDETPGFSWNATNH